MGFLIRVVINTLAIVLAGALLPGIRVDSFLSALAAGLLLGLVNAVVRPVLLILTLPITLLTLGLFILVLNGLCFWLVASLVAGVHVAGFWSAVLGALLVSLVSWLVSAFVSDRGGIVVITRGGARSYGSR
jgi:putative membrane protein